MIRLLNLGERHKHVLSTDPEKDSVEVEVDGVKRKENGPTATVWELAVLSTRVMGYLADRATKFSQGQNGGIQADIQPNLVAYDRVRLGLKGVSPLLDDDGNPIKLPLVKETIGGLGVQEVVSADFMDRIPREVILELAEKITESNRPDPALLGN